MESLKPNLSKVPRNVFFHFEHFHHMTFTAKVSWKFYPHSHTSFLQTLTLGYEKRGQKKMWSLFLALTIIVLKSLFVQPSQGILGLTIRVVLMQITTICTNFYNDLHCVKTFSVILYTYAYNHWSCTMKATNWEEHLYFLTSLRGSLQNRIEPHSYGGCSKINYKKFTEEIIKYTWRDDVSSRQQNSTGMERQKAHRPLNKTRKNRKY